MLTLFLSSSSFVVCLFLSVPDKALVSSRGFRRCSAWSGEETRFTQSSLPRKLERAQTRYMSPMFPSCSLWHAGYLLSCRMWSKLLYSPLKLIVEVMSFEVLSGVRHQNILCAASFGSPLGLIFFRRGKKKKCSLRIP